MPSVFIDFYFYESDDRYNPYGESCILREIDCDYVIPTPDILLNLAKDDLPEPFFGKKQTYTYTLKNGQKLVLDHPLPDDIPLDEIFDNHKNEDDTNGIWKDCNRWKRLLIYSSVIVCPITGIIFAWYYHKKDRKFEHRIEKLTFTVFTFLGTVLFILL